MTMIRSVLFDFNGVILDDESVHRDLFAEVLAPHGVPLSLEDYDSLYLGMDDRGCLSAVWESQRGTPIPETTLLELVAAKARLYEKRMEEGLPLYEGAQALIRDLARRVPLGIVSGALRPEILHALDSHGLREHFAFVISAEDTRHGKPDPEGYRMAHRTLALRGLATGPPSEIAVIEDSVQGIEAARGAGMKTVGVGHTYALPKLREADRVVPHIRLLTPEMVLSL